MRLRRTEVTPFVAATTAAWDGLPAAPAGPPVIKAQKASDLVASLAPVSTITPAPARPAEAPHRRWFPHRHHAA